MKPQDFNKYLKSKNDIIDTSLGSAIIKKNIGQGGNGLVYAVEINNRQLAIKFLVSEATGDTLNKKEKRFLSEFFNIMTLENKKHIVKYVSYDALVTDEEYGGKRIPFIIMDLYESSLNRTTPNVDDFKKLFIFLLNSVNEIHEAGIIHRDIKPENILVKNNNYVLADFGIASFNPDIFKLKAITKKSERLGNRLFSAPEQEEAGTTPDATMDIYAIGQVLHWYVTGKTHRGTQRELISSTLPDLKVYDNIIDICLRNNPNDRFKNIQGIKDYIHKLNKADDIDPFPYLYTFDRICRSNFPKISQGVSHTDDTTKIDRLFKTIAKQSTDFLKNFWWAGDGDMHFEKIKQIEEGVWQINHEEYNISEIWVYQSPSIQRNFIVFKHEPGKPFVIDGEESFTAAIVDNKHIVSSTEHYNGYAEIEGDIVELNDHEVNLVTRMSSRGFIIIATYYSNAIYFDNQIQIEGFIESANSKETLQEVDLLNFIRPLKTHPDVRVRL